eukprot:3039343-Rhodomonas_salina.2
MVAAYAMSVLDSAYLSTMHWIAAYAIPVQRVGSSIRCYAEAGTERAYAAMRCVCYEMCGSEVRHLVNLTPEPLLYPLPAARASASARAREEGEGGG